MSAFTALQPFLEGNATWTREVDSTQPDFFRQLSTGQSPPILWIGCADSRVPETTVLSARPGDVFVHRNVANQFLGDDVSANAVLNYAVLHLGVCHVVVVGHSKCGGCDAAFNAPKPRQSGPAGDDVLGAWLAPLIALRHTLPESATADDLVKANVAQSVQNIVDAATMKEAWEVGKLVYVHGWKYDLETGRISDYGITQGPK